MTMAMIEKQCLFKEKNYSTASRLLNSRFFFSQNRFSAAYKRRAKPRKKALLQTFCLTAREYLNAKIWIVLQSVYTASE